MLNCKNCGHSCHCNKAFGHCRREEKDGDGKLVEFICCTNCRHELDISDEVLKHNPVKISQIASTIFPIKALDSHKSSRKSQSKVNKALDGTNKELQGTNKEL